MLHIRIGLLNLFNNHLTWTERFAKGNIPTVTLVCHRTEVEAYVLTQDFATLIWPNY